MAENNYITAADFRLLRGKLSPGKKSAAALKKRGEESLMQEACVEWFRWQYPSYKRLLFSVPNGGFRTLEMGKTMKAEGMMRGVADLLLLVPRGNWHGLAIEFKTATGSLSGYQEEWGALVMEQGYPYLVVRSRKEFIGLVEEYLGLR